VGRLAVAQLERGTAEGYLYLQILRCRKTPNVPNMPGSLSRFGPTTLSQKPR
jgi:hypothetical protein